MIIDTRFNPWLGTNHQYYGHLDYFYVAGPSEVGLMDAYAELFYAPSQKLRLGARYHYFHTPSKVIGSFGQTLQGGTLGHEVDLMGHYAFRKGVKLSFGYAQMWETTILEQIKTGDVNQVNHWAWLMFDINLELFRTNMTPKKQTDVSGTRF